MAEDLTEYLHEQGVRVRYMHSDIDTLERIEIIRDLRLGAFDVLVGINLLREGLDIPECGLVAILDADKEGFLRSETSLIQTIGRAARNVDGKVILYADKITGSMERAMEETSRRRAKQEEYNTLHGITPESVKAHISDILDSVYERDHVRASIAIPGGKAKAGGEGALVGSNLKAHLEALEKQMRDSAADLDFETAARLRDEIKRLKAVELDLMDDPMSRDSGIENTRASRKAAATGKPVKGKWESGSGRDAAAGSQPSPLWGGSAHSAGEGSFARWISARSRPLPQPLPTRGRGVLPQARSRRDGHIGRPCRAVGRQFLFPQERPRRDDRRPHRKADARQDAAETRGSDPSSAPSPAPGATKTRQKPPARNAVRARRGDRGGEGARRECHSPPWRGENGISAS